MEEEDVVKNSIAFSNLIFFSRIVFRNVYLCFIFIFLVESNDYFKNLFGGKNLKEN